MLSTDATSATPVAMPLSSLREQASNRLGLKLADLVPGAALAGLVRPTAEAEIWRYSRIAKIPVDGLVIASPGATTEPAGPGVSHTPHPIGEPAALVHLIDGFVHSISVTSAASAAGLSITSAAKDDTAVTDPRVNGGDLFVDLALAVATDALVIAVPRGSTIPGVVQVINQVASQRAYIPSSLVVQVGENASVSIVERIVGDGAGSLFTPITQLSVGTGATLRFVSVQELGDQCFQVAHQQCNTGRDATLRTMSVALGGSYARVRTDAVVTEQGGFNELLAVYFGAGHQMHDFRTLQHHIGPRTTSELLFKGAVQDHSQSVYSGLIKIGVDARNAVANQANRNLLLSPTASVESVPNLEIENNEVKCSHASAVGPVDHDHRYYLELRGVPPEEAERLIVTGFFADVLDRSPVPGVAEALTGVFVEKFGRSHAAGSTAGSAAGVAAMTQVKVAQFSALAPSSATRVVVNGLPLAVVRIQDDVYVIDDTCTHAEVSLSEGTIWDDECEIECWKHGTTFSLVSGEPQSLPATQPVQVYVVTLAGDDVLIEFSQSTTYTPDAAGSDQQP